MSTPRRLSARDPAVRRLRRLLARPSERRATGSLVVEGVRAVRTALDGGAAVEVVYAAPEASERAGDVLAAAREAGARVEWLAPGVLERVAGTVTPQPVLAVVGIVETTVGALTDRSLVVVLAGVREPGNAGTLVRSAEAAGASAVVFGRGSVDAWSPKVVRASAGALFHVPVISGETREVLDLLAQAGVRRRGTAAAAGAPYDTVDWSEPTALVLGNEAWGVPRDVEPAIDEWVTIPLAGRSESLNVAMAGSVLLFEARRHRAGGGGP